MVLQTGMLRVFISLDFFLFFVFDAMLVPMYLLIGIWGGPRRLSPPSSSSSPPCSASC